MPQNVWMGPNGPVMTDALDQTRMVPSAWPSPWANRPELVTPEMRQAERTAQGPGIKPGDIELPNQSRVETVDPRLKGLMSAKPK